MIPRDAFCVYWMFHLTFVLFHDMCILSCNFVFCLFRQVEVEIMERMAEAWQSIEAKNARHETSHKLNREKPMFCMDRCAMRLLAAHDYPCAAKAAWVQACDIKSFGEHSAFGG